jgi:hypothetical protein
LFWGRDESPAPSRPRGRGDDRNINRSIRCGASCALSQNSSLDFAAVYAAEKSVTDCDPVSPRGSTIKIYRSEFKATLGWTYKFDTVASEAAAR